MKYDVIVVEALAAAFAPMAHLRVVHRRDPVPAYPILQAGPSSWRSLMERVLSRREILRAY